MTEPGSEKARDFTAPTAAPATTAQLARWQTANRAWWEAHPMRYDWKRPLSSEPGEKAWYEEIDRRFFAAGVIPQSQIPFDGLIPFKALAQMQVLEIGVGMGSHAQLLAQAAQQFVGIDLTRAAVAATRRRFNVFGLRGALVQMNAEKMAFPDRAFDLIWTWGAIHHTANTRAVLAEMRWVLKPTGRALVMVYHRAFIPWYVYGGLIRGLLLGGLRRHGTIHRLVQSVTDGALARYYTRQEWCREVSGLFRIERMAVYGNRAELLPIPSSWVKNALLSRIPEPLFRFWLSSCSQGALLFTCLCPE
jgi:SAM-dependent methyltransferase